MGLFGDLFDFNHNKKTEPFERALEFTLFDEMERERKAKKAKAKAKAKQEEFMDDLKFMDEEERREVLEDAGLDPDDYDF